MTEESSHELVIGLVYGAGVDAGVTEGSLRTEFGQYGYTMPCIHLSNYFGEILGDTAAGGSTAKRQDQGDLVCRKTGSNSFVAQLATMAIAKARGNVKKRNHGEQDDVTRIAWLVRSLRRPEEVELLRRVYGNRFILLGVHAPESVRIENAVSRMRTSSITQSENAREQAIHIIERDHADSQNEFGQRVRDTFPLADFFLDGKSPDSASESVKRTLRIIFGHYFTPPTRAEHAMNMAYSAGLRSSEMGRQVGAAISTPEGDILCVGTNDVPAPGGGLYWSPDKPDGRDFAQRPPVDSNSNWQRMITEQLMERLTQKRWISFGKSSSASRRSTPASKSSSPTKSQVDRFLKDVKGTRFEMITEFGRSVHAEMDAITTAARLGIRVGGSHLATTTFPCHNCTRHIIAAGIEKVTFIHPYKKSLAEELHGDAIIVDADKDRDSNGKVRFERYVGVAPHVYRPYFEFQTRKTEDGFAKTLTDETRALPLVLVEHDTFNFGGPSVPFTRVMGREAEIKKDVPVLLQSAHLNTPTVRINDMYKKETE